MEPHHHAKLFTSYLFRITLSDQEEILEVMEIINPQRIESYNSMLDAELKVVEEVRGIFARAMSDQDINYLNDLIEEMRSE